MALRSLKAFSLDRMDEYARYFEPVEDLAVTEVRYLAGADGAVEELVFFVPFDTEKRTSRS